MLTRKVWDHVIDVKEGFIPKKGKMYLLLREEREEVREFIKEQLRKGYIWPLKSLQIVKIVDSGLYFYFLFSLYVIFLFLFLFFSIFGTTWVRVYQSHCHISHKLMA